MKIGDYFVCHTFGEGPGISGPFKCTEITERADGTKIVHSNDIQVSINVCKKLTRKEVMEICKNRLKDVADEFGVWIGSNFSADGSWPELMCKKTKQTISI